MTTLALYAFIPSPSFHSTDCRSYISSSAQSIAATAHSYCLPLNQLGSPLIAHAVALIVSVQPLNQLGYPLIAYAQALIVPVQPLNQAGSPLIAHEVALIAHAVALIGPVQPLNQLGYPLIVSA
ncbi:hypothetical protein SporoP33_12250 [Sporosarcina sp. P33]|nr:hypothetical protein SporoP33_12250 [Sporosarcina sp. P33]